MTDTGRAGIEGSRNLNPPVSRTLELPTSLQAGNLESSRASFAAPQKTAFCGVIEPKAVVGAAQRGPPPRR
jgi:hypothetical protein